MKESFEKRPLALFVSDEEDDMADRLCRRVMQKVERREMSIMMVWVLSYGIVFAAAAYGLIRAVQYMVQRFIDSGLSDYISLIWSDGSYVMSHWRDLFLSMVDTLPVTAMMAVVALILVGMASFRWCLKYERHWRLHRSHLASQLQSS